MGIGPCWCALKSQGTVISVICQLCWSALCGLLMQKRFDISPRFLAILQCMRWCFPCWLSEICSLDSCLVDCDWLWYRDGSISANAHYCLPSEHRMTASLMRWLWMRHHGIIWQRRGNRSMMAAVRSVYGWHISFSGQPIFPTVISISTCTLRDAPCPRVIWNFTNPAQPMGLSRKPCSPCFWHCSPTRPSKPMWQTGISTKMFAKIEFGGIIEDPLVPRTHHILSGNFTITHSILRSLVSAVYASCTLGTSIPMAHLLPKADRCVVSICCECRCRRVYWCFSVLNALHW